MIKPYIVYNEYGRAMVAHPSLHLKIGVPNQNVCRDCTIEEIIEAIFGASLINNNKLKEEVCKLITLEWEKQHIPSPKILRN